MRKITLFVLSLITTLSMVGQTYTLKPLWVRSVAQSSNPTWNAGVNVRDMDYWDGKLYLNDKNLKALHVVTAETGVDEADIADPLFTGYGVCFDSKGNAIVTQGAYGMTNSLKVSSLINGKVTDLGTTAVTMGGRIDYLEAFGDITSTSATSAGLIAGGVITKATDNICVWMVMGGKIVSPATPVILNNLRGLTSDPTYADLSVVDGTTFWATGVNMIPVRIKATMGATPADVTTETEALGVPINSTSGIVEFKIKGHSFIALPNNTLGSFAIYDITNGLKNPVKITEGTANLGTDSKNGHMPMEAVVKDNTATIYAFSINNGLAAYEFTYKPATEIALPFATGFNELKPYGLTETSGSSMPALTAVTGSTSEFKVGDIAPVYLEGIAAGTTVNSAQGKLKLGGSKASGSITTVPVKINGEKQIQIKMDAVAWVQSSTLKPSSLKINYGEQSQTIEIAHKSTAGWPLTDADLAPYKVTFDAIATPTPIIITSDQPTGGDYRVFIGSLEIIEAPANQLEAPVITPEGGFYASDQNITITAAAGATIHYTTDGSNPTETTGTLYSAPFAITETTVVKAIAFQEGATTSDIASESYQYPTSVATIGEILQGTAGSYYKLTGEATITLKSANSRNVKYIQDASGAIMIDDPTGYLKSTYAMGDNIKNVVGKLNLYNGMNQFVIAIKDIDVLVSSGNEVTPKVVEIADMKNYPGQLVTVKDVSISDIDNGTGLFVASKNYNLNGASTTVLRTQYTDVDYIGQAIPTVNQNITGIVLIYNTTTQLIPRKMADLVAATATGLADQQLATQVYGVNGELMIVAKAQQKVEIYNAMGQLIATQMTTNENTLIEGLPLNEMLLVKVDNQIFKLIIR